MLVSALSSGAWGADVLHMVPSALSHRLISHYRGLARITYSIRLRIKPQSTFPLLALWGNKNGLPSMKVKKMEKFQNKRGLMGCKWSSLNAPGTEIHLCHSILELGEFPFFIIGPLG